MQKAFAVFACALASMGCGPSFHEVGQSAGGVHIAQLELPYSNVFLLRHGAAAALVDAGSPGDEAAISMALSREGLATSDVAYVVVTHGHGDHAAQARFFQDQGAKILLGRGDAALAADGHNDEMKPTSAFATVLRPFVDFAYPAFKADVAVTGDVALDEAALPGVRVRAMPGHTKGSLVVLVGDRDALVGDMMLGGALGGMFAASTPGEHYYQADPRQNRCNIERLLSTPVAHFYLGHGGPVERDAVAAYAKTFGELDCR